jgi:hypothetical protein
MKRALLSLAGLVLAAVASGCWAIGGGGGSLGGGDGSGTWTTDEIRTMVQYDQVGQYSYNNWEGGCTGDSSFNGIVDPITLVIHVNTSKPSPSGSAAPLHIAHHGWPHDATDLSGQYFHMKDSSGYTQCGYRTISLADRAELSGGGLIQRYHTRGLTQTSLIDWGDGNRWTITGTTPHYDSPVWCGHTVKEDWYGDGTYVSAFTHARNELVMLLLESDHHEIVIPTWYWGNITPIKKCDGQLPESNGLVVSIGNK